MIVVVPLLEVASAEAEVAAAGLRRELSAEVAVGGRLAVPQAAINRRRGQLRAEVLLFALRRARTAGERVLGIVDADLYATGLNFVFGLASQRTGVAVISVARLRDGGDPARMARRIVTEAVHEVGHLNGLAHCDSAGCAMQFSNSLGEADAKGPGLCERCAAAIRRARSG